MWVAQLTSPMANLSAVVSIMGDRGANKGYNIWTEVRYTPAIRKGESCGYVVRFGGPFLIPC
jgi:hypothetical protein